MTFDWVDYLLLLDEEVMVCRIRHHVFESVKVSHLTAAANVDRSEDVLVSLFILHAGRVRFVYRPAHVLLRLEVVARE